MICFRFSSESSGKIETGSLDLLDDPTLLEEIVDDVLTSALGKLIGPILEESPEELETRANGIGAVGMLTSGVIGAITSLVIVSEVTWVRGLHYPLNGFYMEFLGIEDSSFGDM